MPYLGTYFDAYGAYGAGAAEVGWQIKVEVAFATQPMAATPTWTDISAYVWPPLEITFGRPDEFSEVQPSVLRLRLRNYDGRFTMGNTAGTYYPNVKVGKRIRVTVVRDAVTWYRFDGHVNGWPTSWLAPGGAVGVCDLTATDRLKRLGRPGDLRSILEEEILRDAPGAYYPLAEPDGATSVASTTGAAQGTLAVVQFGSGGELTFGGGTGPGTDGLSAPSFQPASSTAGRYLAGVLTAPVGSGSAVTLGAWFATDEAAVGRTICSLRTHTGGELRLLLDSAGKLQAFDYNPAVNRDARLYNFFSTASYNDNHTHHAVLTESRSGSTVTWRVYLDGAQLGTGTYTASVLPTYSRLLVGSDGDAGQLWAGTLSHVHVHPTAVAAARIATHHDAGSTGILERTDQRIGRLADYIGIPTADRALDTGDSMVAAQSTSGEQALEAMREVEATEAGVLFCSGDGKLTFHPRRRRYNRTVDLTLPPNQVDAGMAAPGDDFGLVNDLTVTRPGGAPARSVNQASIDEYGLYRPPPEEIIAASDAAAQAAADWRTGIYGTPLPRIPNIGVEVAKLERDNPTLVAGVLATTIGTKLRLSSLPAGAPASTLDLFIEGWTETLSLESWRIEWNTSPGDLPTVWQLGVAGYSELGISTRLAQ